VLKPSIAGEKDEYEVYVELPANEGKGFCASSLFLPPGSAKKQRTLAVSLPSLDALTALRKSVQRSIHERPQGPPFVGRTHEATQLVGEIKSRGFDPDQRGVGCLKNHTPVFEYGTMSGAGKSTWGFEIERVLRNEFAMCAVKAIFLNFYGGTGSGGSDKGAFGRPEITLPSSDLISASRTRDTTHNLPPSFVSKSYVGSGDQKAQSGQTSHPVQRVVNILPRCCRCWPSSSAFLSVGLKTSLATSSVPPMANVLPLSTALTLGACLVSLIVRLPLMCSHGARTRAS